METRVTLLDIAKIRTDGGTQSRLAVNPDIVKEYARLMRDGIELEPLSVVYDGENYWLADGFHRIHAARRVGIKALNVVLQFGTLRDAILFSCGANAKHGLRRTNMDKRKAVETLLRDKEWSHWSNTEIARWCGVSRPTVAKYRLEFEQTVPPQEQNQDKLNNIQINPAKTETNREHSSTQFSNLVKPSDNWNFSPVFYPRIDETAEAGYIPGDVYVNAFWYYVKPGDVVVDPMAGSGMAQVVYNDRSTWMRENIYDFELHLFDLTPQQAYIKQHNLLKSFPIDRPDYIFLDIPYYEIVDGAYSEHEDDLANMTWDKYIDALAQIARNCANAQEVGQLCSVVSPTYVDWKENRRKPVPIVVLDIWRSNGYEIFDQAFATRRIQQTQTTRMAIMNNRAKSTKTMLSDMSVINTFVRQ